MATSAIISPKLAELRARLNNRCCLICNRRVQSPALPLLSEKEPSLCGTCQKVWQKSDKHISYDVIAIADFQKHIRPLSGGSDNSFVPEYVPEYVSFILQNADFSALLCPKCEENLKLEDDYLCETCRWGN